MYFIGRPRLAKMSFLDGFRNARIFKGLMKVGPDGMSTIDENPPKIIIQRLEEAHERNPKDWLILYNLGDWYIREKQYCKSVEVLEELYALRPKDPRSTFALASAYRNLARAKDMNIDINQIFPPGTPKEVIENYDPIRSNSELEKLGLTLDDVALKAMKLFGKTIRLGLIKEEESFVRECLQKMYIDFPHLENKAKYDDKDKVVNHDSTKSEYKITDSGIKPEKENLHSMIYSDARRGSDGIFNEAMGHYTRLRFLMNDIPRFRYELCEVIRLCQWAIAADNKHGDPYVMLANAYSLLDSNVINDDHMFYMKWAGALLQHWKDTPLRNYPFTKNREIGDKLYNDVLETVMRFNKYSFPEAITNMKQWETAFLNDALNPASFGKIKEQLRT